MHLMTWWYLDSSGNWTIEVSLLQRSVAFRSSKCASKYWGRWLSDRFGVFYSTFPRVRLGIMAQITLLTISYSLYPVLCASSIWYMSRTYIQLIILICLTNLTLNFELFPQYTSAQIQKLHKTAKRAGM